MHSSYSSYTPHQHYPHHHHRFHRHHTPTNLESIYDCGDSYGILGSWINGPHSSSPDSASLHNLQEKGAAPRSPPTRLDLEEAFGLAHEALENVKITTVPCLERNTGRIHYSGYDLPFAVFNDLDTLFFRSRLKGNVYLTWARLPRGVYARTSRPGFHGTPRITIELSRYAANIRSATLGILLHQMIHAYYLQSCGHKNKGVAGKGHDLRHKEEFESLRVSIKEHFLPGENSVWTAAKDLLPGKPRVSHRYYYPEAGRSDCYCRSSQLKQGEIDRWRTTALAFFMAKAAHQATSGRNSDGGNGRSVEDIERSAKFNTETCYFLEPDGSSFKQRVQSYCPFAKGTYIIIRYGKRRYPISTRNLRDEEALKKSSYFNDNTLLFPTTFTANGFEILYFYLKDCALAPTPTSALAASRNALPSGSVFSVLTASGPPIVLPPVDNSPPFLASSIAAYKLGFELRYQPLRTAALTRLRRLPCSSEDPIALLEHVYEREPSLPQEDELRAWVRDWFLRTVDPSFPFQYKEMYPNNLRWLKNNVEITPKLEHLLRINKDLLHDVEIAEKAVKHDQSDSPQTQNTWLLDGLQQPAYFPAHNHLFSFDPHLSMDWLRQVYPLAHPDELYLAQQQAQQQQQHVQRQRAFASKHRVLPAQANGNEDDEFGRWFKGLSLEEQMKIWQSEHHDAQYPRGQA